MSESAQTPKDSPAAVAPPEASKNSTGAGNNPGRRPAIVATIGAMLVVAAIGLVLKQADIDLFSGDPTQPTVSFVAKSDIGAAATTLTPSLAGALVDDAERCKVPIVSLTLARGSAALGSTVRIRSGSYVSPYFAVADTMQRIAVPYPAPYGSGAGTFIVEGTATGAILGITPTKVLIDLPGSQSIPVVWRAVSPC
jgi:hypothetical protein